MGRRSAYGRSGIDYGRRVGIVLIVLAALAGFAALGTYIGIRTSGFGHRVEFLAPTFGGKDVVYICAMGEDNTRLTQKRERGLTDTIILMQVDFPNKRVAAISVPRDTRIELPGHGYVKVNAAHVVGGPYLTMNAVEMLTGIKPDYYIKTNLNGFVQAVDILGGVEVDVEKNMHYDDNWGNLHINLKKGRQVLMGKDAMGYVRFRHDTLGDITRMGRQQKFIKAFISKMLSPTKLPKLPWVVKALMDNVDTSMTTRDGIRLAELFREINLSEVQMVQMPAVPEYISGISYMIQDVDKTKEVVQELFFPKPPMPSLEVLNGTGIPGAAQKVAEALKLYGYEVKTVGNAPSFGYESSQIVGHKGDNGLDKLAGLVNTGTITQDKKPESKADITVIVGKDCKLIGTGS